MAAATGEGLPFAGDVVLVDEGGDGGVVGGFEEGDGEGVGVELGLAVAAILSGGGREG